MEDLWQDRWNERFSKDVYAYGDQPNNYLREQLALLKPGALLFPAEGEGRNAVFAAAQGWEVSAFDISTEGRKKALMLAEKNKVRIDYRVGELLTLNYKPGQFDAIALIYAHFPADIKSAIHKTLNTYLRKNGILIFEAFSKKHIEYNSKNETVGGPKDIAMLFSKEELRADFPDYEMIELSETVIDLNEGEYHNGKGSVIRFAGRKK